MAEPADASTAAAAAVATPRKKNRGTKVSAVIDSPLDGLTPMKKGGFAYGRGNVHKTDEAVVADVASFIDTLAERGHCVSVHKDLTTCDCLAALKDKPSLQKSVANAIVCRYVRASAKEKTQHAVDCLRQASALSAIRPPRKSSDGPERNFFLPMSPYTIEPSDDPSDNADVRDFAGHMICKWAFCDLYNIRAHKLKSLQAITPGQPIPEHKMTGKRNARAPHEDAYADLRKRLQKMMDEDGVPFATRMVRDEAGYLSTRNDGEAIYLPPSFTKRKDYIDWVKGRGYAPKKLCRGKQKFAPMADWGTMGGWEEDERLPVVSWRSYCRFWLDSFPNLKVRARGEDTCTDCFNLMNELQGLYNKRSHLQ